MAILIDPQLLKILACPVSKTSLMMSDDKSELIATASKLAYPIRDGIPVMLEEEARSLELDEYEHYVKRKS